VIAAWYREGLEQSKLVDVRAGQAFVAEYVARQEERYRTQYGSEPKRRLREDWRSAARVLWIRQTCGGEAERHDCVAVAPE
jgi:hypothetical protein